MQKNTHYRNDSVVGHSVWKEAIEFPDKFEIIFDKKKAGNRVLFVIDSMYSYKEGKQVVAKIDSTILLLVLGGMYYRQFDDVIRRLNENKFNMEILNEQIWNVKAAYVIGAMPGDLSSNQLWVDKETFKVLRLFQKLPKGGVMELRFDKHAKLCNGFIETSVSFRRNGKLEQVEEYYNIKTTKKFPGKNGRGG